MAFPRAILFIGPPGSGKGTQADFIVREMQGYVHFDAGHEIEKIVNDPVNTDDPKIQTEKEIFESGGIADSEWTLGIIRDHVTRLERSAQGIVFSGNPRKQEEAEVFVPMLLEMYGPGSVAAVHLVIGKETSIFRNSHRRLCKKCGTSLISNAENDALAFCPVCGGEIVVRSLDKPEIIERRFREYEHLTDAILPFLEANGVPVISVNGDALPEDVHKEVMEKIRQAFEL